MKRTLLIFSALLCAILTVASCNNESDTPEDPVPFVGNWLYTGHDITGADDLPFFDNYLFKIDDTTINVFAMDRTTNTATYSYTRKGNRITFTPAFNSKYNTADIRSTYGTGAESICWDCGNGQVYNFKKVE